jgi:Fanconi-associated nuclease 1
MHFFRNITQGKSSWLISNSMDQKVYGTVENLALHHYKYKGYPKGVHCEGALPVTLFGTLFWDEIYNMDVSGAYVSLYQDAPMDLFSSEFYENRKEKLDTKLQIIRKFDSETMSRHLKHEFDLHCEYRSVSNTQGSVFDDSNNLQVSSR